MPRPKKVVPVDPIPETTPAPAAPSPAVLKLQEQVVSLVEERSAARSKLSEQHAVYLTAQAQFQAAEASLKDVEGDIAYRISLIAQLENRATPNVVSFPQPIPQLTGISSAPAPQQQYAVGDASAMRREIMG